MGELSGLTAYATAMTIRPAALLPEEAAAAIVSALQRQDVSRGGLWNAAPGLWQRWSKSWSGPGGSRGDSQLLGSIAVMYDTPTRHQITVYRVTITEAGVARHFSVEGMCDEALSYANLTLAACPRIVLDESVSATPFRRLWATTPDAIPDQRKPAKILQTDVLELLKSDVRDVFRRRSPAA